MNDMRPLKLSASVWVWIIDNPIVGYHRSIEYSSELDAYIAMLAGTIAWAYSEGGIIIED